MDTVYTQKFIRTDNKWVLVESNVNEKKTSSEVHMREREQTYDNGSNDNERHHYKFL